MFLARFRHARFHNPTRRAEPTFLRSGIIQRKVTWPCLPARSSLSLGLTCLPAKCRISEDFIFRITYEIMSYHICYSFGVKSMSFQCKVLYPSFPFSFSLGIPTKHETQPPGIPPKRHTLTYEHARLSHIESIQPTWWLLLVQPFKYREVPSLPELHAPSFLPSVEEAGR